MSKNNLGEHLAWLVNHPPQIPNHYLPSNITSSSESLSLTEAQTTGLAETESIDRHVGADNSQFLRPSVPASVLNAEGKDAMARLQADSNAKSRSRLLSERIPVSLQHTTASTRTPGTSLREQYSAHYGGLEGAMHWNHQNEFR